METKEANEIVFKLIIAAWKAGQHSGYSGSLMLKSESKKVLLLKNEIVKLLTIEIP